MATKFKISIVVHPLAVASANPETQKQQKFLQFAAPESNLAQLWRQIEAFYKTNYLAQSLHNSFAIKKIQDEDGNDLDIFYKLSDIFTAAEKKVLNVIQARVDRDVSIPVTSHLRPAEAFRRPLPPPFNAQPYVNLDPDKPISSTERDSEGEDDESEHAARDRQHDDEWQLDEVTKYDLFERPFPGQIVERSPQDRDHEADDEDDVEVQPSRRNNPRQLPQDDVLAASNRALASLGTQTRPVAPMFAKPALPAPRVQSQRPGQLRSNDRAASGILSRSVSNPYIRASASAKPSDSNTLRYDQNNPFELPESELGISEEEQFQTDNPKQKTIRGASRSAVLRNNSANTRRSSHPAAITPPTSTESLPQIGNRPTSNKAGTPATTNPTDPAAHRISGPPAEPSQGRTATPATANKNLTRVLSRSISATKAPSSNLCVPAASSAPKLLSPFQPVVPMAGADAPSFTTEELAGSQASSVGRLMPTVAQPPPSNTQFTPLDAHIDDVEDSMHEDVLQRAAARRQRPGASKQAITKKSTLEVVPRSTLQGQTQQTSTNTPSAPSTMPAVSQTKDTPAATGRGDFADFMDTQPVVTASQKTTKSTPASLTKKVSSTEKKSRGRSASSVAPRKRNTACETCRKLKKRCTHDVNGSVEPSSQPKQLRPLEMDWVRGLASSAIQQVNQERTQTHEAEPDVDVVMEDTLPQDEDITKELRESLKVPPPPGPARLDEYEARMTTGAEQDKVREERNAKTLTWLRQQQEEAQRSQAAVQSQQQMQQRRTTSREKQDEGSTELAHKKPDRKGKGRAVHNEEDVALLRIAGLPVSDEVMEDLENASGEATSDSSSDGEEAEAGPSNAVTRKKSDRRPSDRSSSQRQDKPRASPPFAVVIQVSPGKTGVEKPQAPTQNSELPESTPLDSQGLPTSAQPTRKAIRRSSAISPTTVAHVAVASSDPVVDTTAQKLKASQELFAFLPDKPEPLPTKRSYKRKAPGSSPPDNLASELHRHSPDAKKRRKVESTTSHSKSKANSTVATKGTSPKKAIDLESDVEDIEVRTLPSSRQARASTAAPSQRPVIVLDHANQSPSRTRRASTHAPTAKQPIAVGSDIELVQNNTKLPSKSQKASTPSLVNDKPTSMSQSPNLARKRSSRKDSNIVLLDGAADLPPRFVRAQENIAKTDVTSTPRRPPAPHRPSAQLITQVRKGDSQVSGDESSRQSSVDNDISMVDDEAEQELPVVEKPAKATAIGKDKPVQSVNKSESSKNPFSGSEELETDLQSSAQRAHDSEERRKSEMDEAIANYVPPPSFPIPSSQPSPPSEPIQASQTSSIVAPVQVSQTSTTRSPESSPTRSTQEIMQQTLPPYRQRSSSPDWLTPQWVRDKEADEADRLEEEQSKRKAELRMSGKKLPAAKAPAAKASAVAASKDPTPAPSNTVSGSTSNPVKPPRAQRQHTQSSSEVSSGEDSEEDSRTDSDEDDKNPTPKASHSMPPPPIPSTPAASRRTAPATPLKSILKKSSSSSLSASTSQGGKQVPMDIRRASFANTPSSASQSKPLMNGNIPQINGHKDVVKNGTTPSQSSTKKSSHPEKNSTAPSQSSAKKAVQPVRNTPFIEDDSSTTDGDVEDNEIIGPAPPTKSPVQPKKTPAVPTNKKAHLVSTSRKRQTSTSSDDDDSTSSNAKPQHRFRTDRPPAASQPAPSANNKVSNNTTRISASSPVRKPAAQKSDSDATTSSDESGESGYSNESDVPEDVEREVARLMAAHPKAKLGATRQVVKFDQRMARRSKREEDKQNAPMRKRTQDLKNMLQGAGLEDPMRALSKRGSGRV